MSNVVTLNLPGRCSPQTARARLLSCFATQRRAPDDVFWLKENAELLGILVTTGADVAPDDLAVFTEFYDNIDERLRFFPQYYRFLLSICLDLEDLGMRGDKGAALCARVARQGLARSEMSDLQRAEARRLLARRGAAGPVDGGALGARLHRFMAQSATFAMPNKKAAYELTHLVFYLSNYGACVPEIGTQAHLSLQYAGLLAFLDGDMDLLAEVCTALRFAGQRPSEIWDAAVQATHAGYSVLADGQGTLHDGYHEYLVTGWAARVAGGSGFGAAVPEGSLRFARAGTAPGALRAMSECMYDLGARRSSDWGAMRAHVLAYLGPDAHGVLVQAERSSSCFDGFFEGFARAGN